MLRVARDQQRYITLLWHWRRGRLRLYLLGLLGRHRGTEAQDAIQCVRERQLGRPRAASRPQSVSSNEDAFFSKEMLLETYMHRPPR